MPGVPIRILAMKTIEFLLEQTGLSVDEIAERSLLPAERVAAIALGRWTPSPEERVVIAAALGVGVEEVSWGHSMNPRNIRYHRFGLKENF
jgi:hypothetical protein